MRALLAVIMHQVPWNGDRIRLYRRNEKGVEFLTEMYLKIEANAISVGDFGYIRRDGPRWSARHGSWEYFYDTPQGF